MPAKLTACYGVPADPAAFERHYFTTHLAIAKRLPGLRGYEVTRGPVRGLAGAAPWHLVATLSFDSMEALAAALASPEGQATAADLAHFATGGVEVWYAETRSV